MARPHPSIPPEDWVRLHKTGIIMYLVSLHQTIPSSSLMIEQWHEDTCLLLRITTSQSIILMIIIRLLIKNIKHKPLFLPILNSLPMIGKRSSKSLSNETSNPHGSSGAYSSACSACSDIARAKAWLITRASHTHVSRLVCCL